jgi:hypothetical protein
MRAHELEEGIETDLPFRRTGAATKTDDVEITCTVKPITATNHPHPRLRVVATTVIHLCSQINIHCVLVETKVDGDRKRMITVHDTIGGNTAHGSTPTSYIY